MKRTVNKRLYGYALYVDYGQGYEYGQFEPTRAEMLINRKAYRENCPYPQRWGRRRELNPEWQALQLATNAPSACSPAS